MKTKSIGEMPASEMTYRHHLIGQALAGMVCNDLSSYEEVGANVILAADSVIAQLDGVRIARELSENQRLPENV